MDRLLEDISSIKTVINRNRPAIQQVLNFSRFRHLFMLCGLSVIGFSMLYYFLMSYYGTLDSFPALLRWSLYAAIALDAALLQIIKQKSYLKSVREIDSNLTLSWWLKELFSHRYVHICVSITVLIVFLSIFFIVQGVPYFIIPAISLCFGLLGIASAILDIRHALTMGYWFFVTGIGTIIFSSIPAPIALSVSIGCGLLIVSILGYRDAGSGKVDESGA